MGNSAWDSLVERVNGIESDLQAQKTQMPTTYPAPSRRRDEYLEGAINRMGSTWVRVRLGDIHAKTPVMTRKTFTFSASYTTGGEDVGTVTTLVHDFQTVEAFPKNGYTFTYDSGANKLKAYTTAGTEVVATTDLLVAVGTVQILVIGNARTDAVLYRALGDEILSEIEIEVADTFTASAANYWTLSLYRRSTGQATGALLGTAYTTSNKTLTAETTVTLYTTLTGLALTADDRIILDAVAATATTARLSDAVLWLRFQKKVL